MGNGNRQYGNYDSRANRIAGGILIIIISTIACLSLFNWMGGVGRMISGFLIGVFGLVSYAYAICGVFLGIMVTIGKRITLPANKAVKYFLLFCLGVMIFHVWFSRNIFINQSYGYYINAAYRGETAAGWLGSLVAWPIMKAFTPAYALVFLIVLFAIVSVASFYPLLQTKLPYRTKKTKIRPNKGKNPVLTDISEEGREERVVSQPVGNSLFVGTLDEKEAAPEFKSATKRQAKKVQGFSMLFPNQDTAGVTEDSMVEPVFDSDADRKKRAKEKLFGSKKEVREEVSDKRVEFGLSAPDDVKPSLKQPKEGFTFNPNLKGSPHGDGLKRPRSIHDAFNLPEDDEAKAKEIQERFGYILDSEVTPKDIRGAASRKIAEPKRKPPEPEPEPEIIEEPEPEIKNAKSDIPEDMPYFIRDILYGGKKEEKPAAPAPEPNEEIIKPSVAPIEEAPKIIKSVNHNAVPEQKAEPVETPETQGSIFSMFGRPRPEKKTESASTEVTPPPVQKPQTFFTAPKTTPRNEEVFLGDFKRNQNGAEISSDAVMPTDDEIKNMDKREVYEPTKPRQPYAPREPKPVPQQDAPSSYNNDFPIGKNSKTVSIPQNEPKKTRPEREQISIDQAIQAERQKVPYMAPPVSLLQDLDDTIAQEDFSPQIERLETTLSQFRIDAKVIGVTKGPTFSRFELKMPDGVSVNNVLKLSDDLAMKLRTESIRFEAPIPGQDAFGIEMPNKKRTPVSLKSVIEDRVFNNAKSMLTFGLGRDIGNVNHVCDIESMPHMLIAGSTGSGKSVCINALILSLLYKCGPNDLKLILIDPKQVELSIYSGLPHLLVPEVIDDPDIAINALDYAINEMKKRFALFKKNEVRNISEYNEIARKSDKLNTIPRIVIVFDELADFMLARKREIEDRIGKLTRLSRAAGLHLVMATQRPSVDIVTGTIKSNLPSRVAFAVKTAADSMTILGMGGAEKLLGKGDMLYLPQSRNEPLRLQCALVERDEVKAVVDYVKANNEAYYDVDAQNEIYKAKELEEDDADAAPVSYAHTAVGKNGESQLFIDALRMCVREQQASISKIQRKFNVGYGTAANIIDLMEEKHYVSANKGGNKTRDVLITMEQFCEIYGNDDEYAEGFGGAES